MKVCHYFEFADHVTGGIAESVKHQRTMLEQQGITYTAEPDLDADILHLNVMGPRSIYYARKARKHDVPVVIHTHNTAEEWIGGSFRFTDFFAGPLKRYLRYAYSLGDRLICPSDYNRQLIEQYADTPTTVMSNGVDTEKLGGHESFREAYLEKYELTPPVVFTVGHVLKRKGLETFVETAEQLPDTDFAWFGYLMRSLKTRETTKIVDTAPDNCRFTGYVDDIRGAYGAGDIFFFPVHEENQGISLLEAMACGKAIVVRDIPIYNWLEHETHCLKADSVQGFVTQIQRVQDDPALRKRLGRNAQERVQEHALTNVGEELAALYRDIRDT